MTPPERGRPTLEVMAAAYAAVVLERQLHLNDILADAPWSADLDAGELTVGERTMSIAMLGSSTDAGDIWEWAWDSPSYGPRHPAVEPTCKLIEIGARFDVPELSTGRIRLSGLYDAGSGGGHTLAFAACGLLGAPAYYAAPYDGGSAWLLVTDPGVRSSGLRGAEALSLIRRATRMFPHDNRLTVETYLGAHGLSAVSDGDRVIAELPGQTACFDFDEAGRLVDITPSR